MVRLISPKRTKNVKELQTAVMQWELTLVEHESKFSEVVADSAKMLPKDVLDSSTDFSNMKNFEIVCLCMYGRNSLDKMRTVELMDIVHCTR